MHLGTGTQGRVAKLTTGADAIEIKATIPQPQIQRALRRYKLSRNNDEQRLIYFFDTPRLELLKAGVIVRARRVVGAEHDSTIKFRPVQPERIASKWHEYHGFKVEVDASETGLVKSASFSMPVRKGLIKKVVAGTKGGRSLFTGAQEAFLRETARTKVDFSTVVVMGPLHAQRWSFRDRACPWLITAELWIRGDRARLMELSVKAPIAQAAAVMAGFMAFLAEVGAERDGGQQAKTRWALDYYAAQYRAMAASKRREAP
jgi:hypothetical protein